MNNFLERKQSGFISIHGHRGARGLYPENTITAFVEAAKLGVQALEMDVVISKDLEVLVSHEAWMNPLFCTKPDGTFVEENREKYNFYHMAYDEVRTYDCGQRRHPGFPQQKNGPAHKPLLREVIAAVEDCIRLNNLSPLLYNIEIKTELPDGSFNPEPTMFTDLVLAVIEKMEMADRVHIQSFDPRILEKVRKKRVPVSLGLLVETNEDLEVHLDRLGFMPQVFSPEFQLLSKKVIASVHGFGMLCIPWTVNDTADMQLLVAMGVDGIITDYPDRALGLFKHKI